MFSGIGGDEFFSGYYDHYYFRQNSNDVSKEEIDNFKKKMLPMIRNPILSNQEIALEKINTFAHHYEDLNERIQILNIHKNMECPNIKIFPTKSLLRSRMFAEISNEIIPVIYMKMI